MPNEQFAFNKYYRPIFSFDSTSVERMKKLGDKNLKKCRFCKKSFPEVKFNKVAHCIPECLGNRKLISYYECDSCNDKFGKTIENQLGLMIKPYKAFRQLTKKGGGTTQLSTDVDIHYENGTFSIAFKLYEILHNHLSINRIVKNNGERALSFSYKSPFIPLECYMAYVKMAISVTPEDEIENLKWAIDWLLSENHSHNFGELLVVEQTIQNSSIPFFVRFFKIEDNCPFEVPMYAFMISFFDFIITIYLPKDEKYFNTKILKEYSAIPFLPFIEGSHGTARFVDMGYSEKILNQFSYEYIYKGKLTITS
jgi:hypothetical protein